MANTAATNVLLSVRAAFLTLFKTGCLITYLLLLHSDIIPKLFLLQSLTLCQHSVASAGDVNLYFVKIIQTTFKAPRSPLSHPRSLGLTV